MNTETKDNESIKQETEQSEQKTEREIIIDEEPAEPIIEEQQPAAEQETIIKQEAEQEECIYCSRQQNKFFKTGIGENVIEIQNGQINFFLMKDETIINSLLIEADYCLHCGRKLNNE